VHTLHQKPCLIYTFLRNDNFAIVNVLNSLPASALTVRVSVLSVFIIIMTYRDFMSVLRDVVSFTDLSLLLAACFIFSANKLLTLLTYLLSHFPNSLLTPELLGCIHTRCWDFSLHGRQQSH